MSMIAEEAANLLLQRYREEHPEWNDNRTPLDEIAAWLGLDIATFHPDDYPEGTYGFMDPDEGENLIWLRRDMAETLRRFTLAHEMGHALLHCHGNQRIQSLLGTAYIAAQDAQQMPELSRDDPCQESDLLEGTLLDQESLQDTLGLGLAYDPRSQRELAANLFAAELLMPLERVHTLYVIEQISPRTLAATFAVSHAALLNRLTSLLKLPVRADLSAGVPIETQHDGPSHADISTPTNTAQSQQSSPKKQYDEFQQAAIEAATPALIVAGPGSGKTSTLIGRVEYMLNTLHVQPQHILALTFSRKAAGEMEERLQQVLAGNAEQALPKVSTFHAFCADVLRQYGSLIGLSSDFALIDDAEGYFLLRRLANQMRLRHYMKLHAPAYYFPDMLRAISRARDELISPDDYAHLAQRMLAEARDEAAQQKAEKALEVAHVYALYEAELRRRGDTDFGGLLMWTMQLWREHPEVLQEQQQKYQHILVDEFQDVNRASAVLLRTLAGDERRVWVVGDSNQAIYGFRGASPANISQFAADFSGAVVLPLSRNYRSLPDLVAMAESFRCMQLELGQEPGKNQPVRLTPSDIYVTLAKATDERSELIGLVQDIRYKHAHGYAYKDMVVLCRTRAQAQKITRTLAEADLPVIERGGMLEQEHIKDLLSILLLLVDPAGMGLLRAARQPEHNLTQEDIEALLLAAYEQKKSPGMLIAAGEIPLSISAAGRASLARLMEITQTLRYSQDLWSLLADYMFIETPLIRNLLAHREHPASAALLADYDALLHLARHYDQQQARIAQLAQAEPPADDEGEHAELSSSLEELIKGFLEYLSLRVLLRQDGSRTDEDEEEQADIIRVMTVHASKGLEFPVVYMPGLVQRRFPMQARSSPVEAPAGMLPPESIGSAAHESGESCLFYVGVTRARDQLVLSHSNQYGKMKYKRSLYLDALEAGLPPERVRKLHWETGGDAETLAASQPVAPAIVSSQPSTHFINAMKPSTSILSARAIESYMRCPREYLYGSIYHFAGDANTYQLFWQATQKTVQALHKQMQDSGDDDISLLRRMPTRQEVRELYARHWQELGGHTAPFATLYEEHGHEVVEGVWRDLATQEDLQRNMGQTFDVKVAEKIVQVTVDRVEASSQTGQPIKFVRTRFGKTRDKPTAETRELLYALASRQQHPGQNVELHSHNLSTGETTPITMTAKKEQSLFDGVEQAIKGLESDAYPARPAEPFRCPTCPFFLICPA
jgi:superfamily I DNA/RNA helicase/Zn-dependent peptidase ImmA (M78 family)